MLKELRERIRYVLDRVFAREFAGQLLLFLALVVGVTLIGMTAAFFGLFSADNEAIPGIPRGIDRGFWDSLWWSLQQVLRLPALERMYGATAPILVYGLFLSVMGLGVFGLLVSLINTAIQRRIEALRKGDTPVKERGHVLILGWSNKVFAVLSQLARLEPGIRVVILAPRDIDEMQEALRLEGIDRERLTVILRSGFPSNRRELDRVGISHASSVIVLSPPVEEDNPGGDSEAVKTIMLLATIESWAAEPPTLTAEIALEQNYELAQIAARGRIHIISSSMVIGKVIVQSIRNPGLADVYSELFAPDGSSIYVQNVPACTNRTLREIAYGFHSAIPIGVAWQEERGGIQRNAAGLNPEPDYEIAADEKVILVARGMPTDYAAPEAVFQSSLYQDGGFRTRVPRRVLLIGWSDNLFDILLEMDAHALSGTEITVLCAVEEGEARERLDRMLGKPLKNLSLEFREGDAVERSAYSGLDLATYQSIVLLADESARETDGDAYTLRALLRLSDMRDEASCQAHIVVELTDGANRDLLTGLPVNDVIVSAEVVSAQLGQIARQKVLGPIYRELLSAGGVEVSLRPAGHYVALGEHCRFADLIYAAQQKMEIALGLRLQRGDADETLLNPSRQWTWQLGEGDRVIVLAQQLYR